MDKIVLFTVTHIFVFLIGFSIGIHLFPILTATQSPNIHLLQQAASNARYQARFDRSILGSDILHRGKGQFSITHDSIVMIGKLPPGGDYRLYLVPSPVTNKKEFLAIKQQSAQLQAIDSFNGFIIDIPNNINVDDYTGIVIWCEQFNQFITAAQYR